VIKKLFFDTEGVIIMSIAAILIERYNNDLMSDANVRNLVRAVAQDPQNETVDYVKSAETVRHAAPRDDGAARRRIIGWLNAVYFSHNELSSEWFFEMCTRLKKLLIVSMILEGDNLRSFGATPGPSDIPQCLLRIWDTLDRHSKQFDRMRADYANEFARISATTDGKQFTNLYCLDD
jgi:hypothetical protein